MLFCNTWYGSGEAQSLWRIMEEKLRGTMTAIYARLCLGLGLFKPEIEEYATIRGDYQLALKLTLQGLEEIQKYQLTAYVWRYCNLGIIYLVLGEIEKAKAIPDDAYQLAAREKNPQDYAMILLLRAYLKLLEREHQAAEHLSEESLKLFQNPHINHLSSVIFAFAALQAGYAARTAEILRKNLGSMNLPALPTIGFHQINLPIIAELKRREGKAEEAALILAVAMQNPQSPIGFFKAWPFVASLEATLKTQLSDTYEAIWERGKSESYLKILRDFVG